MNKRFKPDFDHLLETAYIVEGHGCHGAAHGCCCRGCSECEENYKHEENYESEMEKSGEPGLREIIDSLGKPNTNVPYGDDPEADNPEYNENNEGDNEGDKISAAVSALNALPSEERLKKEKGKIPKELKGVEDTRRQAGKVVKTEMDKLRQELK